jgi:hypothetical protein
MHTTYLVCLFVQFYITATSSVELPYSESGLINVINEYKANLNAAQLEKYINNYFEQSPLECLRMLGKIKDVFSKAVVMNSIKIALQKCPPSKLIQILNDAENYVKRVNGKLNLGK